jgi:CrcB protein
VPEKPVLSARRPSVSSRRLALSSRRQPLNAEELAAIFIGGAFGALLRVGLGEAFATGAGSWPWVTFAINISGSLLLAYLAAGLLEQAGSRYSYALLAPGFCGTYTTFSTMQVEILAMLDHGRYGLASGYALTSVAAGYAAIRAGMRLARGPRAPR